MFAHISINKEIEMDAVNIPLQTFYPRIININADNLGKSIQFEPLIQLIYYSGLGCILTPSRLLIREESILFFDLYHKEKNLRPSISSESDLFAFKGFLTEYQLIELVTKDLDY
jgi:hypothetical protein